MNMGKMLNGLAKLLCRVTLLFTFGSMMCSAGGNNSTNSTETTAFYNSPILTLVWVIGNLVIALLIVVGVIVWYQYLPVDEDQAVANDGATANPSDVNISPFGKAVSGSSDVVVAPVVVSSSPDVIDEKKTSITSVWSVCVLWKQTSCLVLRHV
uniref:Uncharacterized protein n=1 Tax=Ditylenchus dipsaci TaxID=166011 RepID=A0A915DD95_9BILA